jgi:hypothetical protein
VLPEAVDQGYLAILDQVYASGEAFLATAAEYTMQMSPVDLSPRASSISSINRSRMPMAACPASLSKASM